MPLDDGRILRTRISRPVNRDIYGARLWSHVLTDQVQVTDDEFWACVNKGVLPPRRAGGQVPPADALPASLVYQLIHEVGLDDQVVAAMTREQAIARMQQHWSQPPAWLRPRR